MDKMNCPVCGGESNYPDMCVKCHLARMEREKENRLVKQAVVTRGVFEMMRKEDFIMKGKNELSQMR